MMFHLPAFFKKKKQNDNFNLSMFCYVRAKYSMAEQRDIFIPLANDLIKT